MEYPLNPQQKGIGPLHSHHIEIVCACAVFMHLSFQQPDALK